MREPADRDARWLLPTAAATFLVVFALYAPVLSHELRSDDFQWVHQAHRARLDPRELFSDLDGFLRPLNTWSLVVDRAVWGDAAGGYHLTNLLLHALASLSLGVAARRVGISRISSAVVAVIWAASPFTEEGAVWISARFQGFLMIAWMGLLAVWPQREERFTFGRTLAVLGFLFLGAAAKESWVVMPALGLLLELHRTAGSWLRSVRNVVPFGLLSVIYVSAYFLALPGDKDYFSWELGVLAKLPHMLASFLYFEELRPLAFELGWRSIAATALLVGLALHGLKRRCLASGAGAALIVLPSLPELLVAYLPTRHTMIPYAGFLLVVAAATEYAATRVRPALRRWSAAGVAALVVLVVLAGAAVVRADLVDFREVSDATQRLLEESRRVLPELTFDRPVIVAREENANPLHRVTTNPHGRIKIWYSRPEDPYGLVDAAALFDWCQGPGGPLITRVDDWRERLRGVPGELLLHREGRFEHGPAGVDDIAAAGLRLDQRGVRLRVIWSEAAARRYHGPSR